MKTLPIGTKVYHVFLGEGEVVESLKQDFYVKFNEKGKQYYNHSSVGLLSLTEYTLEKGGFTPITEYYTKPKVGDFGYFWDFKNDSLMYGLLTHINESHTYPYTINKGGNFRCFSHEIPEEYIDYVNNLNK
jgi:hypothetical protein